MISLDDFDAAMSTVGIAWVPGVVPEDELDRMRNELVVAYGICRTLQVAAGLREDTSGTVHHLPAISEVFVDFLDSNPAVPYIDRFFEGKKYVLQSMGANFNFPSDENYASYVHRDIRSFWNDRIMLNTLVTLDEFTAENGATWFLPASHRIAAKPTDEAFDNNAIQIEAPAGSVLMWDSRVYHRAGINRTKTPRRIVTPIFNVPSFKPGFDYARAIPRNPSVGELTEYQRQVLGFNARVPSSLHEWYRKPEDRFYRGDQG